MQKGLISIQDIDSLDVLTMMIGKLVGPTDDGNCIFSVPANSRVKLTFENKSSAEGMLHNFVLVELGSGAEIATAGMKAGLDNNFVPKDERVIAYTAVSNMGKTLTIEFDAPAKGSYHYVCTYPGHTNMIGRFNVE